MIALLMLAEAAALPMPAFLAGCWEQQREPMRWSYKRTAGAPQE